MVNTLYSVRVIKTGEVVLETNKPKQAVKVALTHNRSHDDHAGVVEHSRRGVPARFLKIA